MRPPRAEWRAVPAPAPPADREALGGRHLAIFALVSLASVFDGFDTALASLVLPFVQRDFGVGPAELGGMLARIGWGAILAFAVIQLGDRLGRRPVFLLCLVGCSLFTVASGAARSPAGFAALQLLARLFVVSQLALAYVILSEELPQRVRGRANGLLGGLAAVGAALPAALLPFLESLGPGWRGLFAVGAAPFLLSPLYWIALRETRAFQTGSAGRAGGLTRSAVRKLLAPEVRRSLAAMTAVWFAINFWASSVMYFFFQYALGERGLSTRDTAWLTPAAVPFGFAGYAGAGWLMDRFGRRPSLALYLVLASGAGVLCYRSESRALVAGCYVALQMLNGVWAIASTLCAELFPTELRATATAVSANLLGRLGMVAGPWVAGRLAQELGSTGEAVSLLALAPLLALPVVWLALPETRRTRIA